MQIRELINILEEKYPFSLQEEWDNSGLQIGNPDDELNGVVLSLDLEEEAIDIAQEDNKANLIITHHPYLFNPTKSIDFTDSFYTRLRRCIKNDITVFAFHTNLDIAAGGVNDNLAELLNLKNYSFLSEEDKNLIINKVKSNWSTLSPDEILNKAKNLADSLG